MMKILARRLRQARENSGLTQIDAAKKLGISNGTLSGYERDYRDPDTDILNQMADLYDVKTDWLLGRDTSDNEISEREALINKLANEFPDLDLMFKDMEYMTVDDFQDVYDYIKFKKSQKENDDIKSSPQTLKE